MKPLAKRKNGRVKFNMADVTARLNEAIQDADITFNALDRAIGARHGFAANFGKKTAGNLRRTAEAARHLGVELKWLIWGLGPKRDQIPAWVNADPVDARRKAIAMLCEFGHGDNELDARALKELQAMEVAPWRQTNPMFWMREYFNILADLAEEESPALEPTAKAPSSRPQRIGKQPK